MNIEGQEEQDGCGLYAQIRIRLFHLERAVIAVNARLENYEPEHDELPEELLRIKLVDLRARIDELQKQIREHDSVLEQYNRFMEGK